LWWPCVITVLTVIIDQWSKIATINNIKIHEDFWRSGYFYLTHHLNKGAAWGIGSGYTFLLSMVSLAAAIYFIWDFPALTEGKKFRKFTWSLLIGGVLGNWIDRLFRGEVIDMLGVDIPLLGGEVYRFPIFNIADSAICVGVFLYFIHVVFFSPKNEDEDTKDNLKEEEKEKEDTTLNKEQEAKA